MGSDVRETVAAGSVRRISVKSGRGTGGCREGKLGQEVCREPLSPAARLFRQPRFNCHVIVAIGLSTPLDAAAIATGLQNTIARHPRFSSIQVAERGSNKLVWVRTEVVASNHIVVPDLDPTHTDPDWLVDEYMSSLPTLELDPSRPLWDLHLLGIRTSAAGSVAVLRCHHSLGDGISLMSLLLASCRKTENPNALPTLPGGGGGGGAGAISVTRDGRSGLLGLILLVWAAAVLSWRTLVDVALFLATSLFLCDTWTPLKGGEGVDFHPKRFVHQSVSLEDIKDVKKALDCTVNDVLLGVTSAALSRYLTRKYEEMEDGNSYKKHLLKKLRIRSTLLVNIRKTPGIHDFAEMMSEGEGSSYLGGRGKWGNYLGYVLLPFHVDVCDGGGGGGGNPLDYVLYGKAVADRKKGSLEALFTFYCSLLIIKIFGIKVACFLNNRVLGNTTLSFSNMVGPTEQISFCGFPLVYIAPSVYGHPQALTVHFQSYINKMTIVLAVDDTLISDPHDLLRDFVTSLKLIKQAAAAASIPVSRH